MSHQKLIDFMSFIGFSEKKGICFGVAHMSMQANLSGDLKTFSKRIKLIDATDLGEIRYEMERVRISRILNNTENKINILLNMEKLSEREAEKLKDHLDDIKNNFSKKLDDLEGKCKLLGKCAETYTKLNQIDSSKISEEKQATITNRLEQLGNKTEEIKSEISRFLEDTVEDSLDEINAELNNIHLSRDERLDYKKELVAENNNYIDSLSEEEKIFLNLNAFFSALEIYHTPQNHPELFENPIGYQTAEGALQFQLAQDLDISHSASLSGNYDLEGLTTYFEELKKGFEDIDYPISIILTSDSHAVSVAYDPKNGGEWTFIDANNLPPEKYTNETDLAKALKGAYFHPQAFESKREQRKAFEDNPISLSSQFYVLEENKKNFKNVFSHIKREKTWEKLHSPHEDKEGNEKWLFSAIQAGDSETVEQLLKLKNINVNELNRAGSTPLLVAINYENTEIIKLLVADSRTDPTLGRKDLEPLSFAEELGLKDAAKAIEARIEQDNGIRQGKLHRIIDPLDAKLGSYREPERQNMGCFAGIRAKFQRWKTNRNRNEVASELETSEEQIKSIKPPLSHR